MAVRKNPVLLLLFVNVLFAVSAGAADNPAPPPADVPKGAVTKHVFEESKIFPGTTRDYWVYVPKQYDGSKPACLWVNQDGIQNNAPAVFDKLIAAKEMPVTIGIFVTPGRVRGSSANALDRFNRSFEYDGLGDRYVRFLLDELLPRVAMEQNLKFSSDGNDRGIGGSSSGAVCAFTAAWERPDAFRRVFSSIGTYVGLRGANVYPTLLRKTEPKSLRVFLQDGSHDLNIYGGDWWMANQEMERALVFAGYEVNHFWGERGHDGQDAAKIYPDAMRWLWKDWPAPIHTGAGSSQLQEILVPDQTWQIAAEGYRHIDGLAANEKGEVYFNDGQDDKIYCLGLDGKVRFVLADSRQNRGIAIGGDGQIYAVGGKRQCVAYHETKERAEVTEIASAVRGNHLVVRRDGTIYITDPGAAKGEQSRVWFLQKGEKKIADTGLDYASGIALSTDQSLLYVAEAHSHWVVSYRVQADGTVADKQRYYHLHAPDSADDAGAGGLCVDRGGRLYVATRMGVQVCDQPGRVNCILPVPGGQVADVCFGGEKSKTLYAACGGRVFKRELKVVGVHAFQSPIKPPQPHL